MLIKSSSIVYHQSDQPGANQTVEHYHNQKSQQHMKQINISPMRDTLIQTDSKYKAGQASTLHFNDTQTQLYQVNDDKNKIK